MPTIGSITELAVPLAIMFTCLLTTRDKSKTGLFRYPFIFYLVPILIMFGLYELIRALISFLHADKSVAYANARVIYELQSAMGLSTIELDLQAWALQFSWLITICNHFYKQSHWAGSSLFCFYFFKWRRNHFSFCFRWFLACNLLAFVGFVVYPMAPPRLCDELGIVDTIRVVGGYTRKMLDNPLVNNYAAMPSMHFGYSFFYASAYALSLYWTYSEGDVPLPSNRNSGKGQLEWRKQFIVFSLLAGYQLFMMFVIMVTGNHFFLDGIAGMITVVFAFMVSHISYTGSLKLFSKGCHISDLDSKNTVEGLGSNLSHKLLTTL